MQSMPDSSEVHSGTSPISSTHQTIFHASEKTNNKSPTKALEEDPSKCILSISNDLYCFQSSKWSLQIKNRNTQCWRRTWSTRYICLVLFVANDSWTDIEVERPIDHEQAQEVEELSQTDAATVESSTKVTSIHGTPVTTTQQQSPLKSDSGKLSPPKQSNPHSRTGNNSKLSSKSGDSLEAASPGGHNSPTKSNQSSRTGHVDSKKSKERTPISRTSHHEDT